MRVIETLRDNFTPAQVLQIRREEKQAGHRVNVRRLYSQLVEIQILAPDKVIDISSQVKRLY